jgi:hypothetical protein
MKQATDRIREPATAAPSLRLDACEFYNLAPFLGFVDDEITEVGGRAGQYHAAHVGKPRFNIGISKTRISLLSLSMISADVFVATPTPNQVLAS